MLYHVGKMFLYIKKEKMEKEKVDEPMNQVRNKKWQAMKILVIYISDQENILYLLGSPQQKNR